MTEPKRGRRRALAARGRTGELGLTLIELLLSLAILSLLVGFIAGGFTMARRAFTADMGEEVASSTDGAIDALCSLIGSAMPLPAGNRKSALLFEGQQDRLMFVALSEGHAFRGGPHAITLSQSGSDLVVDVGATARAVGGGGATPTAIALRGVRLISFRYFGTVDASVAPSWWSDWTVTDRLPELVSIQIDFEDPRRNRPPRIVALRQG